MDATSDAEECFQNALDNPAVNVGDEDCLYLNVFTKHPGDQARNQRFPINKKMK